MSKRSVVRVAGLGGILAVLYAGWARPRMLRWGATAEEVAAAFPGAEIVSGGVRGATMATTLDAPPEQVWSWLIQMGQDRAGWYSWDGLDNFGRHSAWSLHPEWQQVGVGDRLVAKPDGTQWWEVAAFEPSRFLALRMSLDLRGRRFDPAARPPRWYTDSTWGFLLSERPGGRTRLVVSGYWALQPGWLRPILSVALLEPAHWIMQTRQFTNLQRRVRPPSSRWRNHGEITIARPVEAVFDAVADERTEPRYNPRIRNVELLTPEPPGVGTRFRAEAVTGGRATPMTIQYTCYDRPHRLGSMTRMAAMDIDYRLVLEPFGTGTRMRWSFDLCLHGLMRALRPVLEAMGRRQERRNWAALANYLEATGSAPVPA